RLPRAADGAEAPRRRLILPAADAVRRVLQVGKGETGERRAARRVSLPDRVVSETADAAVIAGVAAAVRVLERDRHGAEWLGIGRRVAEPCDPDLPRAVAGHEDLLQPAADAERGDAVRDALRVAGVGVADAECIGARLPGDEVRLVSRGGGARVAGVDVDGQ